MVIILIAKGCETWANRDELQNFISNNSCIDSDAFYYQLQGCNINNCKQKHIDQQHRK